MTPVHVVVFARAPLAGAAKTRLIPALGAAAAARLHRRLVLRALATAHAAALGPVSLWCAPDCSARFFRALARRGVDCRAQCGADLGARMLHALQAALPAPTLLIGSDCPALTVAHLHQAADCLAAGAEMVFLPAEDGGYVLAGTRTQVPEEAFTAMPWGSAAVMETTRARLRASALRWAEPACLWDVDRPADLLRLAALEAER
ncbi:TIGR04282 family arsenosugar biosynthesis glycosyltransferase [Pseudothauera lacus]|uniref:TIGR04282 family arsenosugar biosynthesis glycosyltransferase n=1 Tax=Pseudothauera lacus TaxID=2136175 RepID=UPI001EED93AF|nr:TIGR04282 family arsenosugar biosynthesis glycosyltransferase [Pseudothauera lacus]